MNGLSANPNLSQLLLLLCGDIELNPGPEKSKIAYYGCGFNHGVLLDLARYWIQTIS